MAELHHERGGFLVDQGAVTTGEIQQQHADHAPMMQQHPAGVTVPPELCRFLHVAVLAQVREDEYRNGALAPAGLLALLAELRAAASGRAAGRIGTVETRWVTVAEAAGLAGVSQRRIRQLAAERKIRSRRHGRDWQIDPQSARDWPARRR